MTLEFPAPAWLVGCGNMAGAMVEGWRSANVDFSEVTVIRPSGAPVEGIRTVTDYPEVQKPCFVMLGFKPQKLDEVAPGLAPHVGSDCTVVSMLAGVSAPTLRDCFRSAKAIVRIMPNLPVAQRQGMTAIYSADGTQDELADISQLIASLGMNVWSETEEELGVVGAIASAGIAYVARFVAALAESGEALGMSPGTAEQVAIQTLIGTAAYAADTGASMGEIARRVASPKGTTEQGLAVLDAEGGLQQLVDRTIQAAVRRSRELAAQAARHN